MAEGVRHSAIELAGPEPHAQGLSRGHRKLSRWGQFNLNTTTLAIENVNGKRKLTS